MMTTTDVTYGVTETVTNGRLYWDLETFYLLISPYCYEIIHNKFEKRYLKQDIL